MGFVEDAVDTFISSELARVAELTLVPETRQGGGEEVRGMRRARRHSLSSLNSNNNLMRLCFSSPGKQHHHKSIAASQSGGGRSGGKSKSGTKKKAADSDEDNAKKVQELEDDEVSALLQARSFEGTVLQKRIQAVLQAQGCFESKKKFESVTKDKDNNLAPVSVVLPLLLGSVHEVLVENENNPGRDPDAASIVSWLQALLYLAGERMNKPLGLRVFRSVLRAAGAADRIPFLQASFQLLTSRARRSCTAETLYGDFIFQELFRQLPAYILPEAPSCCLVEGGRANAPPSAARSAEKARRVWDEFLRCDPVKTSSTVAKFLPLRLPKSEYRVLFASMMRAVHEHDSSATGPILAVLTPLVTRLRAAERRKLLALADAKGLLSPDSSEVVDDHDDLNEVFRRGTTTAVDDGGHHNVSAGVALFVSRCRALEPGSSKKTVGEPAEGENNDGGKQGILLATPRPEHDSSFKLASPRNPEECYTRREEVQAAIYKVAAVGSKSSSSSSSGSGGAGAGLRKTMLQKKSK